MCWKWPIFSCSRKKKRSGMSSSAEGGWGRRPGKHLPFSSECAVVTECGAWRDNGEEFWFYSGCNWNVGQAPPESHVTEACERQHCQSQGCKRGNCTGRPEPGKGRWQSLLVKSRSRADSSWFHDFFYHPCMAPRGKSSHLPFVQRLSLPRTFVVSPATWTTKTRTPCLVFISIGRN